MLRASPTVGVNDLLHHAIAADGVDLLPRVARQVRAAPEAITPAKLRWKGNDRVRTAVGKGQLLRRLMRKIRRRIPFQNTDGRGGIARGRTQEKNVKFINYLEGIHYSYYFFHFKNLQDCPDLVRIIIN